MTISDGFLKLRSCIFENKMTSNLKSEVLMTSDACGQMANLTVYDPDNGSLLTSFKGKRLIYYFVQQQVFSSLVTCFQFP